MAAEWTLYEYEEPAFYGSFWDWEEPRGRIHVSAPVWGIDIAQCPSQDIVRGPSPSYAYAAYVEGLRALRSRSRVLSSSIDGESGCSRCPGGPELKR
jgi:hypothetical protein